jgi:acyl carrier protein
MSQEGSIGDQIRQFIISESNVDDPDIVEHTTDLLDAGIMDSLFMISLVSFCEDTFAVTFDFDELVEDSFRSVNALTELVRSKLVSA